MVADLNGGYVSVSCVGGNSIFVVGSHYLSHFVLVRDRQFQKSQILRESI